MNPSRDLCKVNTQDGETLLWAAKFIFNFSYFSVYHFTENFAFCTFRVLGFLYSKKEIPNLILASELGVIGNAEQYID